MTTNTTTFAVGDRVIIENRGDGWDGVTGTVKTVKPGVIWVDYDDPKSTPLGDDFESGSWTTDQEVTYVRSLVESDVARPVAGQGPKASLTHDTSKSYAEHATSRLLPPWANKVLREAAAGEEVDVVVLRKAATQALSLAATRAAHSTGRRVYAREARHLIYWADAILDSHIAGLPVYEGGPRSPRIHALMAQVEHLEQEVDRARRSEANEVERTAALIREKTALEVEVEDQREITRLHESTAAEAFERLDKAEKRYEALLSEINEAHAALEYAFTLLSNADQSRLAGFRDGYATSVNDHD